MAKGKGKHSGDGGMNASSKMAYNGDKSRASTIPAKWPTSEGKSTGKESGKAGSVSNSSRGPKSVSRR
jgi:hypothetical protein